MNSYKPPTRASRSTQNRSGSRYRFVTGRPDTRPASLPGGRWWRGLGVGGLGRHVGWWGGGPAARVGAGATRGGGWIASTYPDVAQRRFTEDQEEKQGDRSQQEVRPQPAVGQEETQHETDQRHQEGGNGPDVHELVLQMMTGKELA